MAFEVGDVTQRLLLVEAALLKVQEENKDAKKRIDLLEEKIVRCHCQPPGTRDDSVQSDYQPPTREDISVQTELKSDPFPLSEFDDGHVSPILIRSHSPQPSSFECYSAAVPPLKEEEDEAPNSEQICDNRSLSSDFELRLSESENEEPSVELNSNHNTTFNGESNQPSSGSYNHPCADNTLNIIGVSDEPCQVPSAQNGNLFETVGSVEEIEEHLICQDKVNDCSSLNDPIEAQPSLNAPIGIQPNLHGCIEPEVKKLNSNKRFRHHSTRAVSMGSGKTTDNIARRQSGKRNITGKQKGKEGKNEKEKVKKKERQTKPRKTESVSCSVCFVDFSTSAHLMSHQRLRHPPTDRRHKCTDCQYSTDKVGNLKAHMRKHTGERPFSCSHCDKSFASQMILANHLVIHKSLAEYEFQCNICPKRFIRRGNLTSHLRVHNGVKPYACGKCAQRFSGRPNFIEHQRRHHTGEKPFACPHCKKAFCTKRELKKHQINIHTKDYPLKCDKCQKGFIDKYKIVLHKCLPDL